MDIGRVIAGATVVATDGSFRDRRAGSAWLSDVGGYGTRKRSYQSWTPPQSVLVAELRAIALAVRSNGGPLLVLSDSAGAVQLVTQWTAGDIIRCPDEWGEDRDRLLTFARWLPSRASDLRFEHVPGHAGHPLNEGADSLAKMATDTRTPQATKAEYRARADGIADVFSAAWRRLQTAAAPAPNGAALRG